MSNQNAQRIERILVHEGIQEIVGEEDRRLRYVVFLAMLGIAYVLADLIVRARFTDIQRVVFLLLLGVAALVLTWTIRPWHRLIIIDRNEPACRVEWRFLFFIPMSSRSYAFEDRVLDVGRVTYNERVTQGKSGDTPWGCLLIFIPFPLNLLAGAFSSSKGEGEVIHVERQAAVLMLRRPPKMTGRPIVHLEKLDVADPLLRAAGKVLPDNVIMPPSAVPPPE